MPDTSVPAGKPAPSAPVPRGRPVFDPFGGLHEDADRLFAQLARGFGLPALRGSAVAGVALPAVDVVEDAAAWRITAELPGLSEADVDVSVTDGAITISGEKREESERDEQDFHLSERRYGSFRRSFALPPGVDRDRIEAHVEKGVLTVTLPKAAGGSGPKKIEIKAR